MYLSYISFDPLSDRALYASHLLIHYQTKPVHALSLDWWRWVISSGEDNLENFINPPYPIVAGHFSSNASKTVC